MGGTDRGREEGKHQQGSLRGKTDIYWWIREGANVGKRLHVCQRGYHGLNVGSGKQEEMEIAEEGGGDQFYN